MKTYDSIIVIIYAQKSDSYLTVPILQIGITVMAGHVPNLSIVLYGTVPESSSTKDHGAVQYYSGRPDGRLSVLLAALVHSGRWPVTGRLSITMDGCLYA